MQVYASHFDKMFNVSGETVTDVLLFRKVYQDSHLETPQTMSFGGTILQLLLAGF